MGQERKSPGDEVAGIQLKGCGTLLRIGIQNPSSTIKKNWNQVPGIRNPRRGIQNPRLSWIALHVAIPNRTYQGESKGFTVHTFNIKSDSAHSALR